MYKVRCSSLSTLLGGCGKVNNKLEWKDLDKMNDTHIRLAIEIYNKANSLFIPAEVKTLDMSAGNEMESEAIQMYDSHFNTNYHTDYVLNRGVLQDFEKSNDWITGTRDFGTTTKTIDCKISTDKNVFDTKKFMPVETDYTIAMNGYAWLYGSKELELYNALMPATYGQIKKFVSNMSYIECFNEEQCDVYQELIETSYDYSLLSIAKRINIKEVPIIPNFDEIIKKRVEVLNKWIEENKHNF